MFAAACAVDIGCPLIDADDIFAVPLTADIVVVLEEPMTNRSPVTLTDDEFISSSALGEAKLGRLLTVDFIYDDGPIESPSIEL